MISDSDIIRCSCRQLAETNFEIVNVLHFVVNVDEDTDESQRVDDILNHIAAAYVTAAPSLSSAVAPNVIDMFNVTDDSPIGQFPWPGDYHGGSGSGDREPFGVAALAILGTNVKRRQGKIYFGPLPESAITDGFLTDTARTRFLDAVGDLQDDTPGENGTVTQIVVYSRKDGTFSLPSNLRVSSECAYQRRRKRGRGS